MTMPLKVLKQKFGWILCLAALLLVGCASEGVSMRQTGKAEVVTANADLLPKELVSQFTLTAQDLVHINFDFGPGEYHILPDDQLQLNFYNSGLTDQVVVVRPDGRITLPENGELVAAGLSPIELAKQINLAYQSKVIQPLQTTVSLVKLNTTLDLKLNGDYTIRPDGILALPYLGEITAAGRTTREVEADIALQAQKRFQNNIDASIVVKTFAGSIFVGGEVLKPGSYPFAGGLTTLKAVLLAGGFNEDADLNDLVLIHYRTNRDITVYHTSFKKVIGQAEAINDLVLSPQDVVYVPRTGIAQADMFVDQYVNKIIPRSANITYSTTGSGPAVIH